MDLHAFQPEYTAHFDGSGASAASWLSTDQWHANDTGNHIMGGAMLRLILNQLLAGSGSGRSFVGVY